MRKLLCVIACLMFTLYAFAELSQKEKLMLRVMDVGELKATIKKIYKKVQKDDTQIPSTHILLLAKDIQVYCIHPFAEADTGYARKWFLSINTTLKKLSDDRSKQEMARIVKNVTSYRQATKEYDSDLNHLLQLLKHPVKVDKSRLKSLRKKAYRTRRALERKLNQ